MQHGWRGYTSWRNESSASNSPWTLKSDPVQEGVRRALQRRPCRLRRTRVVAQKESPARRRDQAQRSSPFPSLYIPDAQQQAPRLQPPPPLQSPPTPPPKSASLTWPRGNQVGQASPHNPPPLSHSHSTSQIPIKNSSSPQISFRAPNGGSRRRRRSVERRMGEPRRPGKNSGWGLKPNPITPLGNSPPRTRTTRVPRRRTLGPLTSNRRSLPLPSSTPRRPTPLSHHRTAFPRRHETYSHDPTSIRGISLPTSYT